jgi:succinoglycan biosynthesis transport protein ExoP
MGEENKVVPYRANFAAVREVEPEETAAPLSHYLWILRRHRWKLLGLITTSVLITLIVSFRITPIYESTATIDIDRQMPTGVIGQEAMRSTTNDADQFLATQIKLIQSDSVLRPIDRKYHLREQEKGMLDGARVKSAKSEDAPVVLKRLEVSRPRNTYLLLISYRSANAQLAADVSNGIAQSYLEHTYNIRYKSAVGLSSFMERQLEELRAKMERSSAALAQFERELNVINPEEKTSILSSRLLQLNTEYTKAEAERVAKEAAYTAVKDGSMDAAHASSQGEALRKLTEKLNEARQKFAEVQTHFGANHPEYRKTASQVAELERQVLTTRENIASQVGIEYSEARDREQMLKKAVAATKAEWDRLNARSFEYQALKREADTDKKLYEELVRKIKEAGINASFQNSSIRIADPARPAEKPVFPKPALNVLLAFLFSTIVGIGGAVLADLLDNTVRDPEQVIRTLNTSVIGTLPIVKPWRSRIPASSRPELSAGEVGEGGLVHLHRSDHVSTYNEAIRTLRNSILLTDFDRRLRSLLITSASPGEGKSTIAVHLAVSHADQRHRTLLIDCDLRRPSVHKHFELNCRHGLSTVLVSGTAWREVLQSPLPYLDIMPAGPPSRRASDLIGAGLLQLLEAASMEYDLVILDAPPLLGFAEPLQMATAVDGVVVVTRAGQTNRRAVSTVMSTLGRLRANVVGLVLNEVHKEMSDSYYYYGYYGKYYGRTGKNGAA